MTDNKTNRDKMDSRKSADSGEADYLVDREGHVFKAREPEQGSTEDRGQGDKR